MQRWLLTDIDVSFLDGHRLAVDLVDDVIDELAVEAVC